LGKIFTERKESESGRRVGSPAPTIFWREEMRRRERRREEKEAQTEPI
jgi:hypothetical protein